ncbi:MAG: DEAD/DEAH box helicase, partial [Chloroflexota bacterium]|nr:DEAD/DEAH box helicase [Chloroflexota bacterium]
AEDAGKYRDALGVVVPPGLPDAFLGSERRPLVAIARRFARTHGPFTSVELARRLGIGPALLSGALGELAETGTVLEGEFRPGATGLEWIDSGVLRTLRQRSLARLRKEVEPVEQTTLARFALAWHGVDTPRPGEAALLDAIAQLEGSFVPASDLESRILPSRVAGYDESDLDALLASGAVIWAGGGSIGTRDGRVALYLSEHAALVPAPPLTDGSTHERIREVLASRGALFFPQLLSALGGGFAPDVKDALWDLVWAGELTNDSLHPLRAFLRPPAVRHAHRRGPSQRGLAADLAGRWSLVSSYASDTAATPTERLAARVHQLLERHGVITRELVQHEGAEGGFAAVYSVLRGMEEAGRVRRGYFVAGRGAAQFALPGAVDRLRALREPDEEPKVVTLAATDPANPFGAALGWPERDKGRKPMRVAGSLVVLVDGVLAAYVARDEHSVLTFIDGEEPDMIRMRAVVARALAAEAVPERRDPLFIEEIDAAPVDESALAEPLRAAGFVRTPRGYLLRSA